MSELDRWNRLSHEDRAILLFQLGAIDKDRLLKELNFEEEPVTA